MKWLRKLIGGRDKLAAPSRRKFIRDAAAVGIGEKEAGEMYDLYVGAAFGHILLQSSSLRHSHALLEKFLEFLLVGLDMSKEVVLMEAEGEQLAWKFDDEYEC